MTPLAQRLAGEIYRKNDSVALLLDQAAGPIYLRYALVTRGIQEHIVPALLLDDWGIEHNTLALYQWIYENGADFPRAEVFGYEMTGEVTQVFLRALEIYDELPVYACSSLNSPIAGGLLIKHIFVPAADSVNQPVSIDVPAALSAPLQRAAVHWWQVNPRSLSDHGFAPFPFHEDNGP